VGSTVSIGEGRERVDFRDETLYERRSEDSKLLGGLALGCIDDRPWEGGLWMQTAGGPLGLALDLSATMEMGGHISYIKQKKEVHILAGEVTGALLLEDIIALIHEFCAAFKEAQKIGATMADPRNEDVILRGAKVGYLPSSEEKANPELVWDRLLRALLAYRKIAESNLIANYETADRDLFHDHVGSMKKSSMRDLYRTHKRKAQLKPVDHQAGDVVTSYMSDVLFNSHRAWKLDTPAYHVSAGHFASLLAALAAHLGHEIGPVDLQDFTAACAVRTAATALLLPRPNKGKPLELHRVTSLTPDRL
jgi:hypothetical protein